MELNEYADNKIYSSKSVGRLHKKHIYRSGNDYNDIDISKSGEDLRAKLKKILTSDFHARNQKSHQTLMSIED